MKSPVGRAKLDRPLSDANILLVEDDLINQQILENLLEGEYKTFVVSSGREAIEFCHRHLPDLVVMAINDAISRPTDVVARYGGEEFLCVLPNTDEQGVKVVSRLIQEAIDKSKIAHIGSSFGVVTVSMGLATTTNSCEDLSELLAKADTHLYEAKSKGRNCWAA